MLLAAIRFLLDSDTMLRTCSASMSCTQHRLALVTRSVPGLGHGHVGTSQVPVNPLLFVRLVPGTPAGSQLQTIAERAMLLP